MGLRPLACWDCGFVSCRRHGCLSVVSVACCHVELPASACSLIRRSPTECGVFSECDREAHASAGHEPASFRSELLSGTQTEVFLSLYKTLQSDSTPVPEFKAPSLISTFFNRN